MLDNGRLTRQQVMQIFRVAHIQNWQAGMPFPTDVIRRLDSGKDITGSRSGVSLLCRFKPGVKYAGMVKYGVQHQPHNALVQLG